MLNILVTGATGNVGAEVIKSLLKVKYDLKLLAGVRDLEIGCKELTDKRISLVRFDFTDTTSYTPALQNCDFLFLMRPPQISEVYKYFGPLLDVAKRVGVKHIVFLSVQGVEKSKIIPHYKIEKLIVASHIPFTFLRAAYFMQNFCTTLKNDLLDRRRIFLPAGGARFAVVDVRDTGHVAAIVLTNATEHINKSYDLTASQLFTFQEMAAKLTSILGVNVKYTSPGLINFFLAKRREGIPINFILVMIMIHYFPRFQKEPIITDCIESITGEEPITFNEFVADHRVSLCGLQQYPGKSLTN
ncbi:NmrA family NAD(P)-binding protein [Dyadobacter arcticus]|uniref:Uncharacterized protein YbjT (DUF2867 family) n=1 Tax=Dyadobacter arcticus TaxID=1078754 RepID=A0ABX0UHU0_9BACT|nr:NmrA family NAD(P)-binding protein [Dyadobacter arcticus]NIJ52593.1 uncharacterized protein YbjT (DUF2867 family) [Dyadobacter arcticus]